MLRELLIVLFSSLFFICFSILAVLNSRKPIKVEANWALLLSSAFFCFFSVVQLMATEADDVLRIWEINQAIFVVIFMSYTIVVVGWTGRKEHHRWLLSALMVVPIVTILLIASDPWLHLFNSSYEVLSTEDFHGIVLTAHGLGWYLWFVYALVVGIALAYVLARSFASDVDRSLASVFFAGAALTISSIVVVWVLVPSPPVLYEGLLFTFAMVITYAFKFQYGVFDLAPTGRMRMLDIMSDSVIVLNAKGQVADANTAFLKLVGKSSEEVIGAPFPNVLTGFPELSSWIDSIATAAGKTEMLDSAGRSYEIELTEFIYSKSQAKGRMIKVRDIEDRKKAEQALRAAEAGRIIAESERKYRRLMDNQSEGVVTFAMDGRLTFTNGVFEEMVSSEARPGKPANIFELLSPDQKDRFLAIIASAAPSSPGIRFEHEITLPGTGSHWLSWYGKVIFDEAGKPIEVQAAAQDISEKRSREEELALRATLLDSSRDAILLHDGDGEVIYCNSAACEITRTAKEKIEGASFGSLFQTGLPEMVRGNGRGDRGEGTARYESSIRDSRGGLTPVEVISFQVDAYGRRLVLSTVRDISERIRDRERLEASEAQYREFISSSGEGVALVDDSERIVFANPAACRIFGVSEPELIGGSILDFVDERTSRMVLDQTRQRQEGKSTSYNLPIVARDGTRKTILVTATPRYGEDGKVTGTFGIFRDITEFIRMEEALRKSEAEYKDVVESQSELLIRRSPKGPITFVNAAFAHFFGMKPSDLVGSLFNPQTSEEDAKRFIALVRSLTPERPKGECTVRVIREGKGITWMEWRITGLFDNEGNLLEYQGLGMDITDRRRAEEELIKAQKLDSLGLLAGGIAHDFNNSLTSLVSNIEVSMMGLPEGRTKARLKEAVRSAMSARGLTQQLLTFAKGGEPVRKPTDLEELVRQSVQFVLTGSNITAAFSFGKTQREVLVDPDQIGQAIHNIVLNAKDAMPNGGTVVVSVEDFIVGSSSDLPCPMGRYARLSIRDEGTGISEEDLGKVFDPYFTTKEKGSGLGLATTRSIIRKHDGHIEVRSEPGKGTTVTVYLPLVESRRAASEKQATSPEPTSKRRILIMDDEEPILEILSMILEELGYEVIVTRDGDEAIEAYRRGMVSGSKPEIIIMDLTIRGGMGGKEATRRILEIDPDARAIVSSGYSNDPVMSSPEEHGFMAVLPKPYTIEELQARLMSVLREGESGEVSAKPSNPSPARRKGKARGAGPHQPAQGSASNP